MRSGGGHSGEDSPGVLLEGLGPALGLRGSLRRDWCTAETTPHPRTDLSSRAWRHLGSLPPQGPSPYPYSFSSFPGPELWGWDGRLVKGCDQEGTCGQGPGLSCPSMCGNSRVHVCKLRRAYLHVSEACVHVSCHGWDLIGASVLGCASVRPPCGVETAPCRPGPVPQSEGSPSALLCRLLVSWPQGSEGTQRRP